MGWIGAPRKWSILIFVAALVGSAMPTQWVASVTSQGTNYEVVGAAISAGPRGVHGSKPRTSDVSMTARTTAAAGDGATTPASGCAATVTLAVTIAYGSHKEWSRHDVLVYQPPRGVRVLNAAVPVAPHRSPPSLSRHRPQAAPPSSTPRDATSVRFPLARARHGRTTVNLRLALRASPLPIRDRHGHRHLVIAAVVGGATRVMRGQTTLRHATLRLFTPITCVRVRSHGPGGKRTPTATTTPTATRTTATATPNTAPVPTTVTILNYAFSPASITIAPGMTVIWTNRDSVAHTVTADDNSWGSGNLAQGATYSHTFTTPGVYPYHCAIHPGMHGSVTVTTSAQAGRAPPGSSPRFRRPPV